MKNKVTVEGMFQFGDWSEKGVCKFAVQNVSDKMITSFKCEAYGDVAEFLQSQFLSDCKLEVTGSLTKKEWSVLGHKYGEEVVIVADKVKITRIGGK